MTDWYYSRESKQLGPTTLDNLRQMLASGEVRGDDLVFGPGLTEWTRASDVPQLSGKPASPTAAAGKPVGTLQYAMPGTGPISFTPRAMDMLRQTRPWARFIGIMCYIIGGFMVVVGIVMIVAGSSFGARGVDSVLGFVYLPLAIFYIVPGIYLNRYASRIAQLQKFGREDLLEESLEAQKSFWKFVGIVLMVILAIYLLIFIVAGIAIALR